METECNILDAMKGVRRYSWFKFSFTAVPDLMDEKWIPSASEQLNEKAKVEMAKWIKVEGINQI